MKIGDFEISTYNFGFFKLDGGAMFGSVPKNLWSKKTPADDQNRIELATRSLVIRAKDRLILVDVGMGTKWNEKLKEIYDIRNSDLRLAPFRPEEVTDVILTHLHFDHAGGISKWRDDKNLIAELVYPNATVYVQESNLTNAKSPTLKEKASYLKENIEPILNGKLVLTYGDQEIFPGLSIHQVNGHTKGQQYVRISDNNATLLYPTDLIPTSNHLLLPYQMGYDVCAETVMKEKQKFLEEAIKNDAVIVFQHDPIVTCAKLFLDTKGNPQVRDIDMFDL